METKKTWEYVSRVLIPLLRLSHCPYLRISNVKPAHASDDICTHHGMVNPKETITLTITITILYTQREYHHFWHTPYYIYKGNDSRREI